MNDTLNIQQPVVYIRHSKFVGDFMYFKTRSDKSGPIILPAFMDLNEYLKDVIKNNNDMTADAMPLNGKVSKDTCSYSQTAYNLVFSVQTPPLPFNGIKLPKQKDKDFLFPYLLPTTVIRGGRVEKVTANYDLPSKCAAYFRREIDNKFWSEMYSYLEGCELECSRRGKQFVRIFFMERFFVSHNMNLENLDVCDRLYRSFQRRGYFPQRPLKVPSVKKNKQHY